MGGGGGMRDKGKNKPMRYSYDGSGNFFTRIFSFNRQRLSLDITNDRTSNNNIASYRINSLQDSIASRESIPIEEDNIDDDKHSIQFII